MPIPTVVIAGIAIPAGLVGVRRVQRERLGDKWRLTTRNGVLLAEFASEEAMDAWWQAFQQHPERKKARAKKNRTRAPYHSTPVKDDPLMPWNTRYDMPEVDAS